MIEKQRKHIVETYQVRFYQLIFNKNNENSFHKKSKFLQPVSF